MGLSAAVLVLAAAAPPVAGLDLRALERARVLAQTEVFLGEEPATVTATSSPRSPGGPHEFFSEGDYWWRDPAKPGGPYVPRDGQTNPANFAGHRQALMRMCWVMQVAAFARLTGDEERLAFCRDRFRTILVPVQVAADGSFPLETARTKPYGYSIFNLDAMATVAQLLSTPQEDLWRFELPDGRGLRRAVSWMAPFIRDRKGWPFPPDVMYDDQWPMRQASLLFAGLAYGEPAWLDLWKRLPADSAVDEVIRNFFVRQPLLWVPASAHPRP